MSTEPRVWANKELGIAREALGSQREFVEVLKLYKPKITLPSYQKYETGQRSVPLTTAKWIAYILNEKKITKLFRSEEK